MSAVTPPKLTELAVCRCPQHHDFWAVILGDRRITSSKCCGRWDAVPRVERRTKGPFVRWMLRPQDLRELITQCESELARITGAEGQVQS